MGWQRIYGRQVTSSGDRTEDSSAATTRTGLPSGTDASPGNQDNIDDAGPTGATAGPEDPVIFFNLGRLPNDRIVDLDDPELSTGSTLITWTKNNDSIAIQEVIWQGLKTSTSDNYDDIADVRLTGQGQQNDRLSRMDVSELRVSLNVDDFNSIDTDLANYRGNKMVIRVRWLVDNTKVSGDTISSLFTVASKTDDVSKLDIFENARIVDDQTYPKGSQTENRSSGTVGGGDSPSSSSSSFSSSSSSTMPTVATTGTARPSGANEISAGNSGSGGGGGLSKGAIAGIAVAGAVVFLAFIGGAVFWFLRRRRHGKDRGQYNNPANSTTFMSGDKDMHQVTESPHSTFSNYQQQVPLSNLGGAAIASRDVGGPSGHHHPDEDGEYVPYRDDDTGHESPATGRRTDGAGTPHGVSRSVAHLVEEGMTREEIRRLEEEERQLDDAIQRHGQGR